MRNGLFRIGLPIAVVLLLIGAAVWFVPRSSYWSQPSPQSQSPTATEDTPLEALPSQLNRPPVNVAVAVVPWAVKSPVAAAPIKPQPVSTHVSAAPVAPVGPDVAVLPWDQAPKSEPQPLAAAPSRPPEPVAVAVLPWELDAKGAIRPVQSAPSGSVAQPSTNPAAQAVASNFTPGDIPTASLPWETSKPAKRLTHPALPADPVEYAQAIPNCPADLIEWLKGWEAEQAANKATSDGQLQALSQILGSTPLTFTQLFDLGQRIQNVDGDRVGVIFYHAAEPLAAAELAPFAIGDAKAKTVLDMLWNMQWCLGRAAHWPDALANVTLLVQREHMGSRGAYLAEYQFAEATYNAGNGSLEAADKALAIYQRMLDANNPYPYHLTDEDVDGVQWGIGLLMFETGRNAQAVPYLEQVMNKHDIEHPRYIPEILIIALARAGRPDDAEANFESYVRKYRPTVDDVLPLLRVIDGAKSVKQ